MNEAGKFTVTLVFDILGKFDDSPHLADAIANAVERQYNMVGISSENDNCTITAVGIYTEDGYTTIRELG